jgi:hypothetical protein
MHVARRKVRRAGTQIGDAFRLDASLYKSYREIMEVDFTPNPKAGLVGIATSQGEALEGMGGRLL